MNRLDERLNKILPTLTSEKFRENRGLGNEVPFYAFDYPAESEVQVREHVDFLVTQLAKSKPALKVARVHSRGRSRPKRSPTSSPQNGRSMSTTPT